MRPVCLALPLLVVIAGTGCPRPPVPPPAANSCHARPLPPNSVVASNLHVYLDVDTSTEADRLEQDLARYLARLAGVTVPVTRGAASTADDGVTLWVSTAAEARTLAGHSEAKGYSLKRADDGARTRYVLAALDIHALAHGVYGVLEDMGIRFFHPRQEFVPDGAGVVLPAQADIHRAPAFAIRGQHEHLLHPLEYLASLNGDGPRALAEARELVDWVVKTGSNHLQWTVLETVDMSRWIPHATQIVEYAHERGITVSLDIQVWGGSSLQNAYVLLTARTDWQAQMDAQLQRLLVINMDALDLSLGEFTAVQPQEIIDWLNHAVEYLHAQHPGIRVATHNHVGNWPQLWMEHNGETVHYYHLSRFADARLENLVHTVYFFDLYRDWATYNHPNFFHQREFLMERLGQQPTLYFPESAYWIASDVDVPIFLPEYAYSRWLDIHSLDRDIRAGGRAPLKGHVLFSSGKEWGFWLTDYLVGRILWNPQAEFDTWVRHYADIYGACALDAHIAMSELIALQSDYLFDRRLVGYLAAEDVVVDIGRAADHVTRPLRRAFEDVYALTGAERDAFMRDTLEPLEEHNRRMRGILGRVQDICSRADEAMRPWCAEWADGVEVTTLRGEHSALLYRAVTDTSSGTAALDLLAEAQSKRAQAAEVVARRERSYRFDVERLTGNYENPTVYKWGYLKQAHVMCLWTRQELQVDALVRRGVPAETFSLPSCQD